MDKHKVGGVKAAAVRDPDMMWWRGATTTWHTEEDNGRLRVTAVEVEHGAAKARVTRQAPHQEGDMPRYRTECTADGVEILVHYSHSRDTAFAQARSWILGE